MCLQKFTNLFCVILQTFVKPYKRIIFVPLIRRMTPADQKNFYIYIGRKITEARKKAGFKQEVFASLMELSRSSIVNIEKGRQHPSIHLLMDMSSKLKVKFNDLIPQTVQSEDIDAELKKEINKLSKDAKGTKKEIQGFLKEIQSSKIIEK